MNCAKITVTGSGTGFTGPDLFVANLASVNSVKSVLGSDVIYPDPGPSVEYGGDGKTAPPTGLVVTGSGSSSGGAAGSNSGASSPSVAMTVAGGASTPSASHAVNRVASNNATALGAGFSGQSTSTTFMTVTATSAVINAVDGGTQSTPTVLAAGNLTASTPAAAVPSANAVATSGGCTSGALVCSSDGTQFAMCNGGTPTAFQAVAPGTACRNGAIGFARVMRERGLGF